PVDYTEISVDRLTGSFWEGEMLLAHDNRPGVTRAALAMILAGGLAGIPSAAQTIRGTLTGTITDSTGAGLPGATLTVTNNDTSISASTQTDPDGSYRFTLLQPGTYQAVVELSGFKKYVRNGIDIQIAQATRLDVPLQLGTVAEEVQVTGEAPLVRST